jgi:hypothetical protein
MREDRQSEMVLGEPKELAGHVVDEAGRPVAEARVSIPVAVLTPEEGRLYLPEQAAADLLTVQTDATGRFVFARLPATGSVELLVEKPGRATTCTYDPAGPADVCQFCPGQAGIKVILPPEARIQGSTIEKTAGKPVGSVRILALPEPGGFPLQADPTEAAPDGRFEIGGLPAGSYRVQLMPQAGTPAEWVAQPVRVDVEEGKTATDVKLELVKGAVIEVFVKGGANGKPIDMARVRLSDSRREEVLAGGTDDAGLARFRVLPGQYSIFSPAKEGYAAEDRQEEVSLAEGETKRVEWTLSSTPRIAGTVRDGAGKPLGGVELMLMIPGGGSARTDPDGRFEIRWDPASWKQSDITPLLAARDVQRNLAAMIPLDADTRSLDIKLDPAMAVTGTVVNHEGKPLAGARIRILVNVSPYVFAFAEERPAAATSADGRFEIRAIPVGPRYMVTAAADGYGTQTRSTDGFAARENRLDLGTFTLAPANLSVSGIVVDAQGEPVAGASVHMYGIGQPERSNAQTDGEGRFRIDGVCAGSVSLRAGTRGSNPTYGDAIAQAGATDVKIVVAEQGPAGPYVPRKPPSLVGKPLPDLETVGVELPADANDRMLLVCFWDMNQRPSRHCVAQLARQAAQWREQGLTVILVQAAKIEEGAAARWLAENKVPFPAGNLTGDIEKTRFAWGVVSLPHLILTNKRHIVVAEGFGLGELDERIQIASGQGNP